MTQSPPPQQSPVDYGFAVPKRRTNAPAIASLVLGVLGCVPLLTGVLAIVFGIVGIRKARDPLIEGKGLAVAGLVLGVISVLGWSGIGGMWEYGYLESKPAGIVAQTFLQDVVSGNINSAVNNSVGLTATQLQTNNAQMKPFGILQSVSITSFRITASTGGTRMHLEGIATFSNGPKTCRFDLMKVGEVYKVVSYWVQ